MGAFSANSAPNPDVTEDHSSSGRSFLRRFALPIRSRVRHVADFHIRPVDPHRKYVGGDHVEGYVVVTVVKPVRITHLTVSLYGFIRVYKNPSGANEPPFSAAQILAGGGSSGFKYLGNGQATLFQDEQVLSAEGKLEPGKYEFGFDLVFPAEGLPSSIDFERGTISYMITATLTRPTTISPTQSCDRKIQLKEKLDIGPLPPPRPRTISLEPISKKSKRRKPPAVEKGSGASQTPEPAASEGDSTRANENSTEGSIAEDLSQEVQANPRSPDPSERRSENSGDSVVSGSTGQSGRGNDPHNPSSSSGSQGVTGGKPGAHESRTITASIEPLKGGCLPGGFLPVKISVQHIKKIKSVHGVVVTLYRQGRIDSAPPISLFTDLSKEEIRRLEKEEYYPKSKTGLGGLSLTSAGSCSVFRKDLSQTFTPLIIDPHTLKATVMASVRLPEDVFPSIKGVPGELISFKYQMEVIVDLGGKLATLLQSGQSKVGPGAPSSALRNPYDPASGMSAAWNSSVIDTGPLRRQKGVISVSFEVVVGSMDSSPHRGRGKSRPEPAHFIQSPDEAEAYKEEVRAGGQHGKAVDDGYRRDDEAPYPYTEEYSAFPAEPAAQQPGYLHAIPPQSLAPIYIPPPEITDEGGLSEKERIRRAEQVLLPSQPPASPTVAGPSTSRVDDDDIYSAEDAPPAAEAPSAPTLEDLAPASAVAHPTEDKQELERRRLLAESSAPPEFPDDYDAGPSGSFSPSAPSAPSAPPVDVDLVPSAPVLSEEEEYGPHYAYPAMPGPSSHAPSAPHAEPLPRYER